MEISKMFSLEGKVALVTGAAYGIGFAIVEAYAEKGIDAKGYICDVTEEAQVQDMVTQIEQELGVIDILVNNAGIIKWIPMTEMSAEEFRQVVDVDLNAPFIVSKADRRC